MKRIILSLLLAVMILPGCTTLQQAERGNVIPGDKEWAMLPFINNTETPYAAERAEAITQSLMYARGFQKLTMVQTDLKEEDMLPDRGTKRYRQGLEWARKQGIHYAITGTVTEWRYKVGLDGEPVVGMTLMVMELPEGKVLWSGSGGRSGWSRDAVSSVAQQLLQSLVNKITIQTTGEQSK
jgi:hypothetical protein